MSVPRPGVEAARPDAGVEVERCFEEVYRSEAPWLVRFFRRRIGDPDEAQEMTQETMIRFLRAAPTGGIGAPQAYLRRIAINLLRDRVEHSSTRLAARSVPLLEGLDTEDDFDQHHVIAGRQELNEWERILERLKPRTLEIFLLSRVDGFTYQEIAARLDTTVWTVKKQMRKAIAHVEHHRRNR